AGADEIMFLLPPVPHEVMMDSLERVGTEVLPEFIERDGPQTEAKAARLEPLIAAALARRGDGAPPPDPDYEVGGTALSWDGQAVTALIDALSRMQEAQSEEGR